jgi:hypothetical protein
LLQDLENRGSPFRPDAAAEFQSIARELGRTWLFALLLLSGIGLGSALVPGTRLRFSRLTRLWARMESSSTARTLWVFTLCAGALALMIWIALSVFEGVPHERDSVAYLFQARMFAHGVVTAPAPAIPEAFKEDFIINVQGRWFGKYPPGHPLVLALGIILGAPWIVGPVLGSVSVGLLLLLGHRLFGFDIGLLSSVLLLASPFFLFMSGSYLAHTTSLALTLGALAVFIPTGGPASVRSRLALGAVLGALLCTRQLTGVALSGVLGLWLLLDPDTSARARVKGALAVGIGAAPLVALLLWFQWATTGQPFSSPQTLWWDFDRIGFGSGIGAEGFHDLASGLHDTWDRLTELQRHLFGWPFYLTLAPAMVPFILGRARKADWWLLSVAATMMGAYVLYWNRGMAYGPRYFYEALGPLCLLTARGFQGLAAIGSLQAVLPWRSATGATSLRFTYAPVSVALSACLAAALVGFNIVLYMPDQIGAFRGYLGVDGRRFQLVQQAGLNRALVFVREEPRNAWQPYASLFWLNSPMLDSPLLFARDRGDAENARLRAAIPDRPAYLLTQAGIASLDPR